MWKEEEGEKMMWLFVVKISDMTGAQQAKYFRKMKGYRHTDRRVKEPKEVVVQGVVEKIADTIDTVWMGGSFLVECSETGAQMLYDEVVQLAPTEFRVFECEEKIDFQGLMFASTIEVITHEIGK